AAVAEQPAHSLSAVVVVDVERAGCFLCGFPTDSTAALLTGEHGSVLAGFEQLGGTLTPGHQKSSSLRGSLIRVPLPQTRERHGRLPQRLGGRARCRCARPRFPAALLLVSRHQPGGYGVRLRLRSAARGAL